MAPRETPYSAFNFLVDLRDAGGADPASTFGGFSDVSGLSTDITIAEYRNGNEKENHVRKVPGMHKVSDVTLKRGLVGSEDLWTWIQDTRRNGVVAQRDVVITLRDEAGQDQMRWLLRRVVPLKWTGPTLNGKGGGDVAMEELVLSAEGLEQEAL